MRRRVSLALKTAGTRACARASGEAANARTSYFFTPGDARSRGRRGRRGRDERMVVFVEYIVHRGVSLFVRGRGTSAHGGAKDGAVRAAADGVVLAADGVAFDVGESGTQSHGEHVELGRVVGEWKRVE